MFVRRTAAIVLATATIAVTAACGGHSRPANPSTARIVVSPSSAMFYDPASTKISGLPAFARVTVTASAPSKGVNWTSDAVFTSNSAGDVSLSQPSVGGSYRGSDAMGLVETLAPPQPPSGAPENFDPSGASGFDVELSVSVSGHVLATATMTRRLAPIKPQVETLAATGVYGRLFLPAQQCGRKPAVLVFGGSEGGLDAASGMGAALAAQGYPALVVAYFAEPGLPSALQDIPLEYFVKALHLLAKQPGVDPNHLLVWSTSRGSEAALLLGAHFPNHVHGVIAGVPSSVVWGSYPKPGSPAWTLDGKPVPFASAQDWNEPDPADAQDAIIPVEQIHGRSSWSAVERIRSGPRARTPTPSPRD